MRVLGIETSCDETAAAVYDGQAGLLSHCLHSQVQLHAEYGGVVPELASRDHVRRLLPLIEHGAQPKPATRPGTDRRRRLYRRARAGRGAAGRRRRGPQPRLRLGPSRGRRPSPRGTSAGADAGSGRARRFRSWRCWFRAVTRCWPRSAALGDYQIIGASLDDAAGEAFDKTAKLLGLALSGRAGAGAARRSAGDPGGSVSRGRCSIGPASISVSAG